MSTMTRIFVALNILFSVALAAGVVVFVAKLDTFQQTVTTEREKAVLATKQVQDLRATIAGEKSAADLARATLEAQVGALKQALTESRQQSGERGSTVADLSTKLSLEQANSARLAEALRASQSTQQQLNDTLTAMREQSDQLITERSQLNAAVSDLTNRLEVTERDRRFVVEQLTEASNRVEQLNRTLESAGIRPNSPEAVASSSRIGPPINGTVVDTQTVADITYATISVGSADNVEPGMEFQAIDRNTGAYLGRVIVDTVEAQESTGRIEGPAANRIGRGVEVRTRL